MTVLIEGFFVLKKFFKNGQGKSSKSKISVDTK